MSKPTTQETRKSKAVRTAAKDTSNAELTASSTPKKVPESKRITRQTKEKEILVHSRTRI